MEGLVSIKPRGDLEIRVSRADGVVTAPGRAKERPLEYEVVSRGVLDPPAGLVPNDRDGGGGGPPAFRGDGSFLQRGAGPPTGGARQFFQGDPGRGFPEDVNGLSPDGRPIYSGGGGGGFGPFGGPGGTWRRLGKSRIDPKIEAFARKPEVTGSDAEGPLAARRPASESVTPLDGQIAANVEQYLKANFTYTLDLTDAKDIIEGQDPMVAFLYDLHRGHCEYFAGAMTLMCQSLGLQARVVTGFKCDEYNEFIDQYVIRQAHAHAWVEVKTSDGWKTFDPTSGRETVQSTRTMNLVQKAKHLFNYLEYQYGNAVIAYDNDNQKNLIQDVETGMTRSAWRGAEAIRVFREWLDSNKTFWNVSSNVLLALVALLALAPLGLILFVIVQRVRMHRKASRIGLVSLPASLQRKLVRQLGFYDDLVVLLARHGIHRPPHLTPLEFSQSLGFLPAAAYDTVNRLTELFYRVRFGRTELSLGQHKHVGAAVDEVAAQLARR